MDCATHVPDLEAASGHLAADAVALGTAQTTAADGVDAAAGAVSGGLVAALGTFAAEWATRCAAMVTAVDDAGAAAATSASRYRGDDHQAQAGFDALGF